MNDDMTVQFSFVASFEDYEESVLSKTEPSPAYIIFFRSLGEFIGIFSASFVLGAVLGCLTAILTKFTQIKAKTVVKNVKRYLDI